MVNCVHSEFKIDEFTCHYFRLFALPCLPSQVTSIMKKLFNFTFSLSGHLVSLSLQTFLKTHVSPLNTFVPPAALTPARTLCFRPPIL